MKNTKQVTINDNVKEINIDKINLFIKNPQQQRSSNMLPEQGILTHIE